MVWIKRNLFFVIVAILAVGLLAAAGVYGFKNWRRNAAGMATLNEAYNTLKQLHTQNPSPGNDQVNNIETARQQEEELRAWIEQARNYFQPIPPIPNPTADGVTSEAFAAALRRTIDQLQHEAQDASVLLPPQYNFSFEAERSLVRFAPGSLDPLAVQLGEVKAICEILFAAKINSLDNLRRARVSGDDAGGPQSDYLDASSSSNNLAVFTPYEITFRCFSHDLAQVLSNFASLPNGFVVKGINVQPAAAVAAASATPGNFPNAYNPQAPFMARNQPASLPTPEGRSGLRTVLNEQLLTVTMDINLVKLLPTN
ncbi:MAG: hypothetical protein ABR955_07695 [Verrucomicrobiota bacterium]|jgi:hypothetical protein